MLLDDLLSRLDGVRRTSRGWVARCAAHADKSPSLSIAEGERGILLRCWAGCSLAEITESLGLRLVDLFFDTRVDPKRRRQRDAEHRARERQREAEGLKADSLREAEATIAAARNIDIAKWSDEQLDAALTVLADAYQTLEREGAAHG